jgi:hypothetical protein
VAGLLHDRWRRRLLLLGRRWRRRLLLLRRRHLLFFRRGHLLLFRHRNRLRGRWRSDRSLPRSGLFTPAMAPAELRRRVRAGRTAVGVGRSTCPAAADRGTDMDRAHRREPVAAIPLLSTNCGSGHRRRPVKVRLVEIPSVVHVASHKRCAFKPVRLGTNNDTSAQSCSVVRYPSLRSPQLLGRGVLPRQQAALFPTLNFAA